MAKCVCQLTLSPLPTSPPPRLAMYVKQCMLLIDDKYSMCPQWPLEIKRLNVRHIKWYNMKSENRKRWRRRHRLRCPSKPVSSFVKYFIIMLCNARIQSTQTHRYKWPLACISLYHFTPFHSHSFGRLVSLPCCPCRLLALSANDSINALIFDI